MQIAIISDIHNNEINLEKVLRFCATQKITTLICCGDLAAKETLDLLNDNFSGEIYLAFGNMDNDHLRDFEFSKKYRNTQIFKNFGEIKLAEKSIAFVHFPDVARKLSESGKYNFVFYGHTHKPWTEKIGNCTMLNPGNVAGDIYPPTFATWDTENANFKLLRIHELK